MDIFFWNDPFTPPPLNTLATDQSLDIESDNVIKRYQRKQKQLEKLCLVDFVAWFNRKSENNQQNTVKPNVDTDVLTYDCLLENDFNDNEDDDVSKSDEILCESNQYEMKGGITFIKTHKPRIIRSVRFNKNKDPENYCQEQIMLYTPWRNEKKDLLKDFNMYQDRFENVKDLIEHRKQYENHSEIPDQAVQDIESEANENVVAPNAQYRNEQDKLAQTLVSYLDVLTLVTINNIQSTT